MKIGIITAMSTEHAQLANQLTDKKTSTVGPFSYIEGKSNENTIVLMQCGIGKVNAAAGTVELINNFQPDCIISTGVAGGIDTCLKVMDVVASEQIVYHDVWCGDGNDYGQVQGLPTFFKGNETLYQTALNLDSETTIHGGLICTGDQFISDKEQLKQIKTNFPNGLAVDMESASIAQVCYLFKVPFISFRIISDTPGEVDQNFNQYLDFWGEMANRSFNVTKTLLESLPSKL